MLLFVIVSLFGQRDCDRGESAEETVGLGAVAVSPRAVDPDEEVINAAAGDE